MTRTSDNSSINSSNHSRNTSNDNRAVQQESSDSQRPLSSISSATDNSINRHNPTATNLNSTPDSRIMQNGTAIQETPRPNARIERERANLRQNVSDSTGKEKQTTNTISKESNTSSENIMKIHWERHFDSEEKAQGANSQQNRQEKPVSPLEKRQPPTDPRYQSDSSHLKACERFSNKADNEEDRKPSPKEKQKADAARGQNDNSRLSDDDDNSSVDSSTSSTEQDFLSDVWSNKDNSKNSSLLANNPGTESNDTKTPPPLPLQRADGGATPTARPGAFAVTPTNARESNETTSINEPDTVRSNDNIEDEQIPSVAEASLAPNSPSHWALAEDQVQRPRVSMRTHSVDDNFIEDADLSGSEEFHDLEYSERLSQRSNLTATDRNVSAENQQSETEPTATRIVDTNSDIPIVEALTVSQSAQFEDRDDDSIETGIGGPDANEALAEWEQRIKEWLKQLDFEAPPQRNSSDGLPESEPIDAPSQDQEPLPAASTTGVDPEHAMHDEPLDNETLAKKIKRRFFNLFSRNK